MHQCRLYRQVEIIITDNLVKGSLIVDGPRRAEDLIDSSKPKAYSSKAGTGSRRENATNQFSRAGCEMVGTGFSQKSRSKLLESITFYDFGATRPKIIVI